MNASVSLVDRCRYLQALVADPALSGSAKAVAVALVLRFLNSKTGLCYPSYATLGIGAGLKRRAAISAVRELAEAGWITIEKGGGRSRPNTFRLDLDRADVAQGAHQRPSDDTETVHDDAPFTPPEDTETVHEHAPFESERVHENVVKGARPCTRTYREPSSPSGKEEEEDAPGGARLTARSGSLSPNEIAKGFERFWRHCPWQMQEGPARDEFARIVGHGLATIDELVDGMKRYAAKPERQIKGKTTTPAKWLKTERWKDADPPGQERRDSGTARRRPISMAEEALRHGGWLDEEGRP